MMNIIDIYISGLIFPISRDLDKDEGLQCEGFGHVESWSITGYEVGVVVVWFSISMQSICV